MKEGKMEQSILGFKANHPDWDPVQSSTASILPTDAVAGAASQYAYGNGMGKSDAPPTTTTTTKMTTTGGAKVKDLLDHIYKGRGTTAASRW